MMATMRMMVAVVDKLSSVIISFNPREKNELKSSIKHIDRAKEKFSTETRFERGKNSGHIINLSSNHRQNALERWGIPF